MNVGESVRFDYTGNIQQLVIEKSGIYQFDVYAGKGGNIVNNAGGGINQSGGYGGYVKGYKKLKKGDTLFIGVGGAPSYVGGNSRTDYISSTSGGYNGGGNGYCTWQVGYASMNGAGGGATHIALNSNRGTLPSYASNQEEVLIVAGGGGGAYGQWEESGSSYSGASGGTGGGNIFGQGINASSSGWQQSAGGGGWQGGSRNSGGTNNTQNVPSITYGGITYAPQMQNGINGGNGYAIITLVAKTSSLKYGNKDLEIYYEDKQIEFK